MKIAQALDDFGVEYIELTSPAASPESRADCEAICKMGLKNSKCVCAPLTRFVVRLGFCRLVVGYWAAAGWVIGSGRQARGLVEGDLRSRSFVRSTPGCEKRPARRASGRSSPAGRRAGARGVALGLSSEE